MARRNTEEEEIDLALFLRVSSSVSLLPLSVFLRVPLLFPKIKRHNSAIIA